MKATLQPAPAAQPTPLPVTDTTPTQGPAFGRNPRRLGQA